MTVHLTKEDPKTNPFYNLGVESCVKCDVPTRFWWATGCMPLCQECATKVTRKWCLDFAREHNYGPLPDKQYRDTANKAKKESNQ